MPVCYEQARRFLLSFFLYLFCSFQGRRKGPKRESEPLPFSSYPHGPVLTPVLFMASMSLSPAQILTRDRKLLATSELLQSHWGSSKEVKGLIQSRGLSMAECFPSLPRPPKKQTVT